jgi:hypothetical protein
VLCFGEQPWGARKLLALIRGIPPKESALARRVLSDSATWDAQTELAASTVDLLQVVAKALGADFEITPVPRPAKIAEMQEAQAEPLPSISAGEITSFLKGL